MTTQNVDKIYDGNGNQFNIQIDIDRVNNLQTTLNGKAASSHNHDASNITSGTFPTARIADDAITAAKVKDNETLPCNISGTAVKANTIDLGGNSRWIWASSSYSGSGGGQVAIIGTLSITANGSGNWNNIHENLCWCSRHSGSGILSIYVCMPGSDATTGADPTVLMRNSGAEIENSFSQPVQCRLKRTQVSSGTCRYVFTFYVSMNDYNYCAIYGRLNSPRDAAIQFTTGTNIVNNSDITDDAYGPWLCQSVLNVAYRDSSGNWLESTYLKLSGGNMTGNIGYTSGGATNSMIKFRGGSYGHGISIGGGGCTIVGSGEAADAMIPQISVDDESLHLGGDNDVVMYANLQNGWSNRKTFRAGQDGNFYIPGAYYSDASGTLIYWKGNQNITAVPTASNQEWSIDLKPGSYTGTYWHVWTDKDSKGSLLKVETDNGHVSAPYGFYGSLTGNASTATTATNYSATGGIATALASKQGTLPIKDDVYDIGVTASVTSNKSFNDGDGNNIINTYMRITGNVEQDITGKKNFQNDVVVVGSLTANSASLGGTGITGDLNVSGTIYGNVNNADMVDNLHFALNGGDASSHPAQTIDFF